MWLTRRKNEYEWSEFGGIDEKNKKKKKEKSTMIVWVIVKVKQIFVRWIADRVKKKRREEKEKEKQKHKTEIIILSCEYWGKRKRK